MNLLTIIEIGVGGAATVLVGCLVATLCGVDGFRGDKRRDVPVAAPVTPVERPAPVTVARGPIRVTAERVSSVEAA